MKKFMVAFISILLFSNVLFSQENEKCGQNSYKHAKIYLSWGEVLTVKNLSIADSLIHFRFGSTNEVKTLRIASIKNFQVARSNYLPLGLFLGGALAFGTCMIINATGDVTTHSTYTTTYSYDESGHQSSSTSEPEIEVEKTLSTSSIAIISAAAALVGGFIGYSIHAEWETIYPEVKTSNVTLSLSLSHYSPATPCLALQLKL